jgi:hypothetical protein
MAATGADRRGNVVGVDPHRHTLSATVVDERGGIVATGHYNVSGEGHRALEAWALSLGPVVRWGIEGASGLGRHTSVYLCRQGHDVRDVCPTRTAERAHGRYQGKSDALDSERIARETLAHLDLPVAFKRVGDDSGPDETTELIALWHKERRSLLKTRQHLLNEADALLSDLPDELRGHLPSDQGGAAPPGRTAPVSSRLASGDGAAPASPGSPPWRHPRARPSGSRDHPGAGQADRRHRLDPGSAVRPRHPQRR